MKLALYDDVLGNILCIIIVHILCYMHSSFYKVLKLAAVTGAIIPGISSQGRIPPRKPGDDEKIAKRLGQPSGSNGNGKK